MGNGRISQRYLADLNLTKESLDIEFLNQLQSRHIAKYSFNNLAVILGQELPLDESSLFNKIVERGRGGYCFEHNKLVFNILSQLGFKTRLLLAKVVYNRDVEAARTHRITLVTLAGEDYIVDAGFGHLGARFPVKINLGKAQDQGDSIYRIIKNDKGEYCYQVFKNGDFFSLYTFDLCQYTETDCMLSHFFSSKHSSAAFVNNLVISLKFFNEVKSLRNNEFHHIKDGKTKVTLIDTVQDLHKLLTEDYQLSIDIAISEFLHNKFIITHAVSTQ